MRRRIRFLFLFGILVGIGLFFPFGKWARICISAEAAGGPIGEPGLGLLGDVRGMIVEDQLDR